MGGAVLSLLFSSSPFALAEVRFAPSDRIDGSDWFTASAIGDVTGDGRPDLVSYRDPIGDDQLRVYEQKSDGSLASPTILESTSTGAYYPGIAIGDVNADGRNDVALAAYAGADLYQQTAAGSLDGPHPVRALNAPTESGPWPTGARSVQIADFSGDGLNDLAVGTYDDGAVFLRNAGSGFAATSLTPGDWELQEIEVGDMNGDSALDLAWGPFPQVELALGTGTGSFSDGGAFNNDIEEGMEIIDVTADDRDDLVVTTWAGLRVFEQGANGLASAPTQRCNSTAQLEPVEAADVTGDGLADAVAVGDRSVLLYPGFATGGLSDAVRIAEIPSESHYDPSSLSLGDLNGDGRVDVALATLSGLLVIRQAADSVHVNPSHPCDTTPPAAVIADEPVTMNEDGTLDVEVSCPADEVSGPCQGSLSVRTKEEVTFQGRTNHWTFGPGQFSVPAGETQVVSVGGWWEDRALLVQRQELDVGATALVGDQQRNSYRAEAVFRVLAPPGTEPLRCGGVLANFVGTKHDDSLSGRYADDVFVGGAGDDSIWSAEGADIVCGGPGDDYLAGEEGDDVLRGGIAHDQLLGGAGNDSALGGPAPDKLRGGPGRDVCRGGAPRGDTRRRGDSAASDCEQVVGAR